uniref:Uncharacterized protein n=1 Tax=Anguilla anguilla TaxID=7936 RepID=A0A0E9USU6_ANGAN
MHIICEKCQI